MPLIWCGTCQWHPSPRKKSLCHESSAGIDICKLHSNIIANHFDDLVLVEEINLPFGGVYIYVDALRVDVEAQVRERMSSFREKG
jgi:hypothetical protein